MRIHRSFSIYLLKVEIVIFCALLGKFELLQQLVLLLISDLAISSLTLEEAYFYDCILPMRKLSIFGLRSWLRRLCYKMELNFWRYDLYN